LVGSCHELFYFECKKLICHSWLLSGKPSLALGQILIPCVVFSLQHAAAVVDEKLYIVGGSRNGRHLSDVQVYGNAQMLLNFGLFVVSYMI